jgi:hypothetical protein
MFSTEVAVSSICSVRKCGQDCIVEGCKSYVVADSRGSRGEPARCT